MKIHSERLLSRAKQHGFRLADSGYAAGGLGRGGEKGLNHDFHNIVQIHVPVAVGVAGGQVTRFQCLNADHQVHRVDDAVPVSVPG